MPFATYPCDGPGFWLYLTSAIGWAWLTLLVIGVLFSFWVEWVNKVERGE